MPKWRFMGAKVAFEKFERFEGFEELRKACGGLQIRSYITRGLTNCLPPSRLGITQTSLVLLSLLRRLQIPVNMKLA